MYAIIETGGKQYRVQVGDQVMVEKLNAEVGKTVTFDHVLVCGDGKNVKVGAPYVDTAVTAKVLENGKAPKVIVFKYKAKKDYRKKQGHRQPYTLVEILTIGGEAPKAEAKKAAAPKAETKKAEPKKEAAPKAEAKKAEPKKEAAPKAETKKAEAKVSASMKKEELIAFAKANNIAIDEKATKAVIIEAIEAALK